VAEVKIQQQEQAVMAVAVQEIRTILVEVLELLTLAQVAVAVIHTQVVMVDLAAQE
jgi:hypothetical protein